MRRLVIFVIVCLAIVSNTMAFTKANAAAQKIQTFEIKGAIVPVTADYVDRAIGMAEDNDAICIILMDTPGGLGTAMEEICQRIIRAEVPVIVYVVPGGWAASAGTYISMAAHIAAMGPGSTIGAASPIASSGEELPETAKKKAIEFYQDYLASLAAIRDHNVDWAREAVVDSIASTADEALAENVIDILASDFDDLVSKIDGLEINFIFPRNDFATGEPKMVNISIYSTDHQRSTTKDTSVFYDGQELPITLQMYIKNLAIGPHDLTIYINTELHYSSVYKVTE